MICRESLPYSIVEGEAFKNLAKLLAPLYKAPCRKTVTDIIYSKYEEKKALVVKKLHSVNNVCLTVDEWRKFVRSSPGFIKVVSVLKS